MGMDEQVESEAMEGTRVRISEDPKSTDEIVRAGLRAFNRTFLGDFEIERIAVDVCGDKGDVLGGAVGSVLLGWLFVDLLWIPETLRSSGIGTRILEALELEATRKGAKRAILDTTSFQAEEFYKKQGFVECGRVANFALGYDRIYMIKTFEQSENTVLEELE